MHPATNLPDYFPLLLKTDQKKRALENLKKYLGLKPKADDRSMITSYLESHSK